MDLFKPRITSVLKCVALCSRLEFERKTKDISLFLVICHPENFGKTLILSLMRIDDFYLLEHWRLLL